MALIAGTRLGPYEIISPLGAGGMGEVYKGRDTRLGRPVAIKILAPLLAEDPAFRARFDREAQTISSLSHPHICTLFDVGKEDGVDFLVLEYLEGQTLAALCANGPLPVARAIAIGLDICDALAAAHRAGVLHRDLKPGNVMLASSGVKLLDFGLAKASPVTDRAAVLQSVATVSTPLTARGMILGTSQYMAPEQYDGRPADARSDIWAFGCILYEMIAGRRPFDGETTASIIGAIVSAEPPALPAAATGAPAAIAGVIRGCLDKDPEVRWQDIRDVRRAIEAARVEAVAAAPPVAARNRLGWIAAALAVLLLAAVGALARSLNPAPASLVRFDVGLAAPAEIQRFTDTRPYFAVSPDGTRIVIVAVGGSLWIRSVGAPVAQMLPGTAGAESPFWSADGRSIGFFTVGAELKRVSIDGGSPTTLCRVGGSSWNGSWAPDGTILFAEWGAQRMMRVSQDGGPPAVVSTGTTLPGWPHFLPDGRHFLFNGVNLAGSRIDSFLGSLDSPEVKPIAGVASRMEYVAGRLVFWRDGTLLAQPFDIDRARLTGMPKTLADHVHGFAITGFGAFSASRDTLLYQAGTVGHPLEWLDRQGRPLGSAGPAVDYVSLELSPDGSSVVYSERDQDLGTNDVSILDLERNAERRLISDRRTENLPIWTPDGQTIVYAANRTGPPSLFAKPANGPGDERAILAPVIGGPQRASSVTPDGKFLLYVHNEPQTAGDILMVPIDGSGAPVPVVQTRAREGQARLSRDGAWLAYVSDESGRNEVYVQRFRDAATRRQVSQAGGATPRWRADSREIFFLDPGRDHLWAVDLNVAGAAPAPGIAHLLFTASRRLSDYDVTRDGQKFLLAPDAPREASALSAVLNWQGLLR
jgi:eukaryotic-like serine/threonine-protein kinase